MNKPITKNGERGAALVAVLMISVPLIIFSGVTITALTTLDKEVQDSGGRSVAEAISESGAHDALARLKGNLNFRGEYEVLINGGRSEITISDVDDDGLDNNGDGMVDDDLEKNLIAITSRGLYNEGTNAAGEAVSTFRTYESAVEVIVAKVESEVTQIASPVYIADPLADVTFSGDAWKIRGQDRNLDGSAGPEKKRPGIGVPGPPDHIRNQLRHNQKDNITGVGGASSIEQVDRLDLNNMREQLVGEADRVFEDGDTVEFSMLNEGDVVHYKGNLDISGRDTFSGVLIVDGDLKISGTVEIRGLIIVKGNARLGGGGRGIMIGGAIMVIGEGSGVEFWSYGTIDVFFSSEALDTYATVTTDIVVSSWTRK